MKIFNIRISIYENLWVIIYKLVLDFSYLTVEARNYRYLGFNIGFAIHKIVLGYILYFATYNIIKSKKGNITTLFTYTIFFLSISPFITLYQFSTIGKLWMVMLQVLCLILMDFLFRLPFKTFGVSLKTYSYANKNFRLFATFIIGFYFLFMVKRYGIPSLDSMLLQSIHETRAAVDIPTGISILQTFFCRIICPLYILIAWREKKWIQLGFGLLVQIHTYGITGFKTFLFIPIVMVAIDLFKNIDLKKLILVGLSGTLILTDVIYFVTKNIWFYALAGDRVIFFPALIKYAYFDYFSVNDFVYFSQNSISRILGITSNYNVKIPNLIGGIYFNKFEMWTNTGFMADAYSNLGIIGVILIALFLSVILIILRNRIAKIPETMQKSIQMIFLLYFIMLNDGPLIATLFSGGFLVAMLIVLSIDFQPKYKKGMFLEKRNFVWTIQEKQN